MEELSARCRRHRRFYGCNPCTSPSTKELKPDSGSLERPASNCQVPPAYKDGSYPGTAWTHTQTSFWGVRLLRRNPDQSIVALLLTRSPQAHSNRDRYGAHMLSTCSLISVRPRQLQMYSVDRLLRSRIKRLRFIVSVIRSCNATSAPDEHNIKIILSASAKRSLSYVPPQSCVPRSPRLMGTYWLLLCVSRNYGPTIRWVHLGNAPPAWRRESGAEVHVAVKHPRGIPHR